MTATIIQFRLRPDPHRDAQKAVEAMFQATWAPFFAWCGILSDAEKEIYARGLAIDTEKEPA